MGKNFTVRIENGAEAEVNRTHNIILGKKYILGSLSGLFDTGEGRIV